MIVALYRKKAAAAAPAAALVTDPAGNQCSTLNPATGYCPGTQADIAAQQSAAAQLSSASGAALSGGGGYYYTPPASGTSATGSAVPTFADNASWAQYVETALSSSGADATAAAIAKYLSGQQVTTDQQTIIEEAIAIANKPPVSGANGMPPSLNLAASSPTTPVGGPAVIVSIPDGSGGWERVTFPNQDAVTAWDVWNEQFAQNNGGRTQAYRSEWNAEITRLGGVGTDGPLKAPSTATGNPNDAR